MWHDCGFGDPRLHDHDKHRIDKGVKRKAAHLDRSEKTWIKRRRQDVTDMLKEAGEIACATSVERLNGTKAGWTAQHQHKETELVHKRMTYFVDAVLDGTINVKDLDDDFCQVLVKEIERRNKAGKARVAKVKNQNRAFHTPDRALSGLTLFIEQDVDVDEVKLRKVIQPQGINRTADRTQADIFVLKTPAAVGKRTAWACLMRGAILATLEYVLTQGKRGTAIAYRAAGKTRICVHCTIGFSNANPVVFGLLKELTTARECNWKWIDTAAEVKAITDKLNRAGRQAEVLVLVSAEELRHRPQERMASLNPDVAPASILPVPPIVELSCLRKPP